MDIFLGEKWRSVRKVCDTVCVDMGESEPSINTVSDYDEGKTKKFSKYVIALVLSLLLSIL
jgi:predicted transcriptional regulator